MKPSAISHQLPLDRHPMRTTRYALPPAMIFSIEILAFITAIILVVLTTAHFVERNDRMNTHTHDDHNDKLIADG
jgi:hypothetical protein